jgi:hypothetical protein
MNSAVETLQYRIEWLSEEVRRDTETIKTYTKLRQQIFEKRAQHIKEIEELREALTRLV